MPTHTPEPMKELERRKEACFQACATLADPEADICRLCEAILNDYMLCRDEVIRSRDIARRWLAAHPEIRPQSPDSGPDKETARETE